MGDPVAIQQPKGPHPLPFRLALPKPHVSVNQGHPSKPHIFWHQLQYGNIFWHEAASSDTNPRSRALSPVWVPSLQATIASSDIPKLPPLLTSRLQVQEFTQTPPVRYFALPHKSLCTYGFGPCQTFYANNDFYAGGQEPPSTALTFRDLETE